jgi:hypothetical protein
MVAAELHAKKHSCRDTNPAATGSERIMQYGQWTGQRFSPTDFVPVPREGAGPQRKELIKKAINRIAI